MAARRDPRTKTIEELTRQLRRLERARKPSSNSPGNDPLSHEPRNTLPTGIEPLDQLLPDGGFSPGTLIEWLADGQGTGAATLALLSVRQILLGSCSNPAIFASPGGKILVVVDPRREFYPPAAAELGIDLANTIVLRPETPPDALWALEQSLRTPGVAVAFAWLDRLSDRAFRRLQLAAEKGGGLGIVLRPAIARQQPSWAEVRLLVQSLPVAEFARIRAADKNKVALIAPREESEFTKAASIATCEGSRPQRPNSCEFGYGSNDKPVRRLRVEVLYARGGVSGRAVELEISDETAHVHSAPPLAPAARPSRSAGA